MTGCIITQSGKDFYVLSGGGVSYALDIDTGLWTRMALAGQTDFGGLKAATVFFNGYGNTTLCFFNYSVLSYYFDRGAYQDAATPFPFTIQSDLTVFDTNKWKTVNRISVISDQAPQSSFLSLSWSDNDYQTWNAVRQVDVGTQNPVTFRCGRFRKRAFKLTYTDNFPMRIRGLELNINVEEN